MERLNFPATESVEFPTSRSQGRDRRLALEDELKSRSDASIVIDFGEVRAMTISFADEFLAKFVTSFDGLGRDFTVAVRGLNDENREAIEIALERRKANVVLLEDESEPELLGDKRNDETFRTALGLGSFRAIQIADLLKISPQNANNRLQPLVNVGALRKSRTVGLARGGKEFVYVADVSSRSNSTDAMPATTT
jgi:hypothetical protein